IERIIDLFLLGALRPLPFWLGYGRSSDQCIQARGRQSPLRRFQEDASAGPQDCAVALAVPALGAAASHGPSGCCEPRTDLLILMSAYRAVRARRQLLGEAGSASSDARPAHRIPQAR